MDFPKEKLLAWKDEHEELMTVLLKTHSSPLPLVRRFSTNTKVAQDIVDTLSHKGVMFQPHAMENPVFAIKSVEQIRRKLQRQLHLIDLDKRLREICENLISAFREVMNENSRDSTGLASYLDILRIRVGRSLHRLQHDYGCQITGNIAIIVRP